MVLLAQIPNLISEKPLIFSISCIAICAKCFNIRFRSTSIRWMQRRQSTHQLLSFLGRMTSDTNHHSSNMYPLAIHALLIHLITSIIARCLSLIAESVTAITSALYSPMYLQEGLDDFCSLIFLSNIRGTPSDCIPPRFSIVLHIPSALWITLH